jgi:hypothetical protein
VAQSAAQVQAERGLAVVPAVAATAPGRTALVIGNATYSEDLGPLKNPGNDATENGCRTGMGAMCGGLQWIQQVHHQGLPA